MNLDNLCWFLTGGLLFLALKRILDNPQDQPETTMQYLANNPPPPRCNWCLEDDCNTVPEPGSYYCKDHAPVPK